jgi:hypothetical protein
MVVTFSLGVFMIRDCWLTDLSLWMIRKEIKELRELLISVVDGKLTATLYFFLSFLDNNAN